MPQLNLNGDVTEYSDANFPATVAALVESLGLKPGALVAEVEGRLVRNDEFSACALEHGFTVELVQFVGGG